MTCCPCGRCIYHTLLLPDWPPPCPPPPCCASPQESLSSAIKTAGVDVGSLQRTTSVVTKTATESAAAAQPFISKAVTFLTTTDPVR